MRLFRLLAAIVAISTVRELAHRANLLFQVVRTAMSLAAGVVAIGVVFLKVRTLAGWRFEEAIAVLGAFQVVNGLTGALVEPNLAWFSGRVTGGQLDDLLLHPAPSLFLASLGTCNPWSLLDSLFGAGTLLWAATRMSATLTVGGAVACVVLLLIGFVIDWAWRVLLASFAFWAPGVHPVVLYSALWQAGRYPVGIYPRAMRALLIYVVPVAFVATFPARALTHGPDLKRIVGGLLIACIACLIAHVAWQAGLRRYTGATS
jgi:ABC-2 type transport system permease protein